MLTRSVLKKNPPYIETFPDRESQKVSFEPFVASFKDKFKFQYRFHISIIAGINIMFITASRDYAPFFFNIHMFINEKAENKTLNQVYCITNFFFPLFFGYITDYVGYHMGLIALHFPIIFGSFFMLMSTYPAIESTIIHSFNFECAIVGRILFSVGGESLQIILMTVVMNYFRKSKKFVHGIIICTAISEFGSALVKLGLTLQILQIQKEEDIKLFEPSMYSLIFSLMSLVCSGLIIIFENYWKKLIKQAEGLHDVIKDDNSFLNERGIYPYSFWQAFKKILNLKVLLVALMNGMMWGSFFCMLNYNKRFFDINFKNILQFQLIQEVFTMCSHAVMCFTILILVARYINNGKQRNFLMMFGCLLNSFAYILYSNAYENINTNVNSTLLWFFLILGTISLGMGMGFFSSALLCSVPFLVKEKNLTIGYGIVLSVTNFFKFLLISLTPSMTTHDNFLYGKNPFWLLSCLSILLAIVLEFCERKEGKLRGK